MIRTARLAALLTALTGCAHQIVITPDVSQLDAREVVPITRNVGYFISPADRELQVITPGGGGDNVSYFPYRELEPGLFKVLSNVFRRAYPVAAIGDAAELQAKDITFVLVPKIRTDSSSDGLFTWPPTKFMVELDCKALDRAGTMVWQAKVVGEGEATLEEFMKDFPLAARRASLKALAGLQKELSGAAALRSGPPTALVRGVEVQTAARVR